MSGKGKRYWEKVWDEQTKPHHSMDRMLERYSFLCCTTYGSDIRKEYYIDGKVTPSSISIDHAMTRLKNVLNGRKIWRGGDLHNIILVASEKTSHDYESEFSIAEKPCACFCGMFSISDNQTTRPLIPSTSLNNPTSTYAFNTYKRW